MQGWRRTLRYMLLASIMFLLSCDQACKAAKDVQNFINSISDGAPCKQDAACLGQRCLTDNQGYPGGYCTTFNCETNGCSGLSSQCFKTTIENKDVTACYALCNFDGTCDRADEGYQCVTLQDTAVCLPPGATNAPVQGSTGSSCATNVQCNGDNATCLTNFFGGYCSQLDCTADSCLDGNPCLTTNPDDPMAQKACFRSCTSDKDCRFQYSCQDYAGKKVCLESKTNKVRNPDGADDGAECKSNLNCKGGTCIREAPGQKEGDVSFPGGYCTTRDCGTNDDCNGGLCVSRGRSTTCLASCSADSDCRDGYHCVDSTAGKVCDTIVAQVAPDPTAAGSFDVTCGSAKSFDFTIPDGSVGFFVGPFTKDGQKIAPQSLTYPDGSKLDIPNDYAFGAINPDILGGLAPMLFPESDESPWKTAFVPGKYSMTVQTSSSQICWYVVPQPALGSKLKINLYFVGTPGITAANAKNNQDISDVMQVVRTIYSKMKISASVANYFDVSDSVAQQYSTIRDFNDIYALVGTSTAPGSTKADNLSVNVFLINDFNISEVPGLLGLSTGIPGMAGLHGNSGSGLVFSTASLGSDNVQLGQTMAHEIGHFLGLRHTTEQGFQGHDPISDTPECLDPNLANFCPDSSNLMFPFALGGQQQDVTTGQTFVVRHNPLVQ